MRGRGCPGAWRPGADKSAGAGLSVAADAGGGTVCLHQRDGEGRGDRAGVSRQPAAADAAGAGNSRGDSGRAAAGGGDAAGVAGGGAGGVGVAERLGEQGAGGSEPI